MSTSFQTVDLATMTFPAELHIDYVRVYQREGEQNIGCSPKKYPTADYIDDHMEVYTSELCCCCHSYAADSDKDDLRP